MYLMHGSYLTLCLQSLAHNKPGNRKPDRIFLTKRVLIRPIFKKLWRNERNRWVFNGKILFSCTPPFERIFLNLKFQWRNERWRISGQKLNDETNENDFYGQINLTKRDEIFVNESFVRHWRTICVP